MSDGPLVEALCLSGIRISHCMLMSHTAIEEGESNKKSDKIQTARGEKFQDTFIKL